MRVSGTGILTTNILRQGRLHENAVSKAVERISSGLRINRAADDPAGMARAGGLRAQLSLLLEQQRVTADGVSSVDADDSVLGGVQEALQRMHELALQAADGTLGMDERRALDAEYQELMKEIRRSSEGIGMTWSFPAGGESFAADGGSAVFSGVRAETVFAELDGFLDRAEKAAAEGDRETLSALGIGEKGAGERFDLGGAALRFLQSRAQELSALEKRGDEAGGDTTTITFSGGKIAVCRMVNLSELTKLWDTGLLDPDAAHSAAEAAMDAINAVSAKRGELGAERERFQREFDRLAQLEESLTAELSNITDADMAAEMMNYVKEQALSQAAAFLAAQQNHRAKELLAGFGLWEKRA